MPRPIAFLTLAFLPLLTGCFTVASTAATESAIIISQERSVGEAVDDAGILLNIKNLFLQKDMEDLLVNVEIRVVEGRVLLTGNVNKAETQIQAVRLTWTVNGVREVMNEIQINDKSDIWNYAQDVWVSAQIRTRLLLAKDIRSVNYSVITVNQTAYLMGIAQDQAELNRATYLASVSQHVKKVVSYVRLKSDPRRPT